MTPFTQMRLNVEFALAHSAAVTATGAVVLAWNSAGKNVADDPQAALKKAIRVDTTSLTWEPFAYNAKTVFRHTLQLFLHMPQGKGLNAGDLEALFYAVCKALAGMTRDVMQVAVPECRKLEVKGGEVGLAVRDEARPKSGDFFWSQVCAVEIEYEIDVSAMIEPEV